MEGKVALIILHYKGVQDTLECLASVNCIPYHPLEVIVVNNSATRCEEIQAAHPHVTFIHSGGNLGFAEGNNRGIAHALASDAEYIFLLNNDTVVDPDIVQAFVSAMHEDTHTAVLGAHIYYYDEPEILWYAGGEVDADTARCYHKVTFASHLRPTAYACGCALFIKAEAVRHVGSMDPRFFLLWEEVDWCWRLRKAGFACKVAPSAKVWHKVSRSFEGGNRGPSWQYFYWRNRLLFFEKHSSKKDLAALYLRLFLKEICQLLWRSVFSPQGKRARYRAALSGIRDYMLRRFGEYF